MAKPRQTGREGEDRPPAAPRRRRGLLRGAIGLLAAGAGTAAYALGLEPTWVEVVANDLPVPNLPPAWEGLRVAHLADLHHGRRVPLDYLAECVDLVQGLGADLVAATGDFISHRQDEYGEAVAKVVGRLRAPLGVFACLGNHDFGLSRPAREATACTVAAALVRGGVRLLRNEAVRLSREGRDLWVVGVDDLWSGGLDARGAMAQVPRGGASLALCHNPDAAPLLADAGAGAILAGHTHGGQVHLPGLGPLILPVRNRQWYRGLHRVGGSWLYVNRGVGWLVRIRLACRPEITVHTLRRAEDAGGGSAAPAGAPPPAAQA